LHIHDRLILHSESLVKLFFQLFLAPLPGPPVAPYLESSPNYEFIFNRGFGRGYRDSLISLTSARDPTNHATHAKDPAEFHFLTPFVLASFVCFVGNVRIHSWLIRTEPRITPISQMTNPFDDPITDDGSLITDHGCASLPLHHSALVIGRSSGIITIVFPHSLGFPVERAVSASRTDSSGGEQRRRGYLSRICRSLISDLRFLRRERASAPGPAVASRRAVALREGWLRQGGFTLIELLVVMGIIAILMVLIAPAFTTIKGGGDATSAAYTIKGALDTARTYAKANNTYTWVGFYEEDVSQPSTNPPTPGTGRLVMSIVASKGGTMLYTIPLNSLWTLDGLPPNPVTLIQVGKLIKIDNLHLKTFPAATATPPPDTFNTRPAAASTAQIGDVSPPNPYLAFHYPVNVVPAQYTFTKVVQFSPRGEGLVDDSTYFASGANLPRVSEIGVEPTHGATVPASIPANVVAVQFTGFASDVKIYRR
jgi:prepilin-type N-terminal cleavage/methylation domain-containing protein